jgi:hypothetical protein
MVEAPEITQHLFEVLWLVFFMVEAPEITQNLFFLTKKFTLTYPNS